MSVLTTKATVSPGLASKTYVVQACRPVAGSRETRVGTVPP